MINSLKTGVKLSLQKMANKNRRKKGVPIIGDKKTGSLFDPFFLKANGEYFLFLSIRNTNSVGVIKSSDGINWSSIETILVGIPCTWEAAVNRPSALFKDGCFYLYYTGQSNGISRIGLATSVDGKKWKRCLEPVLCPLDFFEGCATMNPSVIFDPDSRLFKMWYSAGENYEPNVICYAESDDGIKWKRFNGNPIFTKSNNFYDCNRVSVGQVSRIGRGYLMAYIGYETINKARICLATSITGKGDWTRLPINPVITYGGRYSRNAVYRATFDYQGDCLSIWFNGRTRNFERILFARIPLPLSLLNF